MWKKRVIVAAIGEKGVRYGSGHGMPRILLELVSSRGAPFFDYRPGGCLIAYPVSARSFGLMERFLSDAEAARETLPALSIGIAECRVLVRYQLLFRPHLHLFRKIGLYRKICVDPETIKQVQAKVQGPQNYRDDFERFKTV